MIAIIDVDYTEEAKGRTSARAACVVVPSWGASAASAEYLEGIEAVADYVPGQFFRRELPCILAVLERVEEPIDVVVVDSYVVLDQEGTHGLGGYLWEALGREVPVIGVAKNPFRGAPPAQQVLRGDSSRPLFVTALGVDPEAAAHDVRRMHGRFRLPTMIKRVDRLCRDGA